MLDLLNEEFTELMICGVESKLSSFLGKPHKRHGQLASVFWLKQCMVFVCLGVMCGWSDCSNEPSDKTVLDLHPINLTHNQQRLQNAFFFMPVFACGVYKS